MKKLLISLSVFFVFLFYSTYKQNKNILLTSVSNPSTLPPQTPQNPGNAMMVKKQMGVMMGLYKDGVYIGDTVDVYYGNVQVQAFIQNGRISDVKFLQSPNDRRTSIEINSQAMPMLQSEAIQRQNANVDGVSGATATSQGFIASLGSALDKAK